MMRGEFGRKQGINTIKEDIYLRKRDVMQINALNRLNPALQQGLMWGFILGIVQIAFSFISGSLGLIGTLIALALYLVFAWMAGQRASQRTGRTATGVWAGLLTGAISALLSVIVSGVFAFTNFDAIVQSFKNSAKSQGINPNSVTPQTVTTTIITSIVITFVLAVLLGLVGGALGGSRGRRRALPPTDDQYQESMFEPPARNSPVEPPSRTPPVDS
jgi:hypothetical protein